MRHHGSTPWLSRRRCCRHLGMSVDTVSAQCTNRFQKINANNMFRRTRIFVSDFFYSSFSLACSLSFFFFFFSFSIFRIQSRRSEATMTTRKVKTATQAHSSHTYVTYCSFNRTMNSTLHTLPLLTEAQNFSDMLAAHFFFTSHFVSIKVYFSSFYSHISRETCEIYCVFLSLKN